MNRKKFPLLVTQFVLHLFSLSRNFSRSTSSNKCLVWGSIANTGPCVNVCFSLKLGWNGTKYSLFYIYSNGSPFDIHLRKQMSSTFRILSSSLEIWEDSHNLYACNIVLNLTRVIKHVSFTAQTS